VAIKAIDSKLFIKMFLAGAANIEAKKEVLNDLNVFPIPDGDTGTNMCLTIMSAVKEVNALNNPEMKDVAKAISSGSLRGARGNSGVILSQLLRGFTISIREVDTIDTKVLADALTRACNTAYKAVMKPKEGTILTVARGIANKASEMADTTDDLSIAIPEIVKYGEEVLAETPEMLPILKEAGVVDSGGQGLMEILYGALAAFQGKEIDFNVIKNESKIEPAITDVHDLENIKYGYCTEFLILNEGVFDEKVENDFKEFLSSIGDSVVCVADDDLVKIHVHTDDPGLALQKALEFGQLSEIDINNMREELAEVIKNQSGAKVKVEAESEAKVTKSEPRKRVGFVSVSIGDGLNEIFRELGVDKVIEGGQTMNPSTDDMLSAINGVNADNVFILPNNKNIILTADQAKALTKDKNVIVIPTKTVPQGISSMIHYMETDSIDEEIETMKEAMSNVKTGQVTYAVRDTKIDDKEIKKNDIMGICDDGISAIGNDIQETTLKLIENIIDGDSEIISLYYGVDIEENSAKELGQKIEEKHPDLDIEIHYGGQPIYYYVLSIE